MLLAKALYDNIAESPEELAMRRGDILTVLERDAGGLEGWWLCLLKGRRGIVPGNRLRVLDTAALSQRELAVLNAGLTPADERGPATKEWHDPNKVVIPQRLGDMFVYDLPKRTASAGHYDVPPRRAPVASPRVQTLPRDHSRPRPAPRSAASSSDYDHPACNRPLSSKPISGPDPGRGASPVDHYDVPGSNRSSTLSVMSTGSNLSALSGGSGAQSSLYESERSSLDLSGHDTYDVPPPARAVPTPAPRGPPAGGSVGSPTYDTPKSSRHRGHRHSKSLDLFEERAASPRREAVVGAVTSSADGLHAYAVPTSGKPISRNCSADSGISLKNQVDASSLHTYDVPIPQQYDTPSRCRSAEDSLDYDTPKSRDAVRDAPSKAVTSSADVSVYDVPPRVTKDTGSSLRQATDEVKRVSSGSSDSEIGSFPYEELRMELTAAMESIVSLQHSVNSSCSKLLSFVCPAWRHPDNLEPKVYEIKLSALAVRTSGRDFVEFAHGALANAAKSDDKRLVKKLGSAVESLSELLNTFAERLQRLNADMWPLVRLVRDEEGVVREEDDLDVVIRVARDIPESVRRVSGLIQGNSMVLFRRNESPNVGAAPLTSTPRPKAPPPVKPKPRLSTGGSAAPLARFVSKSVDSTPTSEHPPSAQTSPLRIDSKCDPGSDAARPSSFDQLDYDVPKASSAELLSEQFDSSQRGLPDGANIIEEYDYVSLTKEPAATNGSLPVAKDQNEAAVQSKDVPVYAQVQKDASRSRQVKSLLPPPDVSTSGLSPKFQERLEKLQKEAEEPVKVHTDDYDIPHSRPVEDEPPRSQSFSAAPILPNDRQILSFYAIQMEKHSAILMNAIEAFVRCIDEQQPPKTFIAYSKYVILAAHKLVYIGDTLTRHLTHENIRNDIMNHAFGLCELLKGTVTATKKAALEYPAVKAVQEMVDKVSEVSVAANQFKNLLAQFAS